MTNPLPRASLWSSIAAALRDEIAQGHYGPGDKLPTESALATRFGVNRHTVRQALAALTTEGITHARQGSGVFVTARPTDYPLGRRVRFHRNILASGRTPSRRISRLETRPCDGVEAAALQITAGDPVHVVEGVSLADGQPLALFRSVFAGARFTGLLAAMADQPSVTAALAACGLTDYTRATTRISAERATPVQAAALMLGDGAPVLRSVSVNVDAAGVPVEFGTTWFAGDRVALTLTDTGD